MISQMKNFTIVLSTILIITACSGKKNSTTDLAANYDDSSLYYDQTTSQPTNLFDFGTTADPQPQTGTATNYGPITQSENLCLSQDSTLFGNSLNFGSTSGTTAACYANQNYITPELLFSAGIGMYSSLDQCLGAAMSLEPQTDDPNEIYQKTALAEMIIFRCVRHQLRQQWAYTNWSTQQNQVYAGSDFILFSWLQQTQQQGF